jgi:hypothetical protein
MVCTTWGTRKRNLAVRSHTDRASIGAIYRFQRSRSSAGPMARSYRDADGTAVTAIHQHKRVMTELESNHGSAGCLTRRVESRATTDSTRRLPADRGSPGGAYEAARSTSLTSAPRASAMRWSVRAVGLVEPRSMRLMSA